MAFDHNRLRQFNNDGSHVCEKDGCAMVVLYDDEPYCFEHSPASGSTFVDYSYMFDTFNINRIKSTKEG